jgi:hypothetical protein
MSSTTVSTQAKRRDIPSKPATYREALQRVRDRAWTYFDAHTTGSGGRGKFPAIKPGDPLHAAVVEAESFWDDKRLPGEGWNQWCKLLALSREKNHAEGYEVGLAASGFVLWCDGELSKGKPVSEADGVYPPNRVRIGGIDCETLSALECRIVGYMMDQNSIEARRVVRECWPERTATERAIRTRLDSINRKLRADGITGFQLHYRGGYIVKQ